MNSPTKEGRAARCEFLPLPCWLLSGGDLGCRHALAPRLAVAFSEPVAKTEPVRFQGGVRHADGFACRIGLETTIKGI